MTALMAQKHWQAPDNLRFFSKDPAFVYRGIKKVDVPRRLDEGWEIATDERLPAKQGEGPTDRALHYRGLIIMRMPRHMGEERNAYYRNLHQRRLRAVARGAHMSSVARARTSEGAERADGSSLAGVIGGGLKVHQGVVTKEGLTHTDNIDIPAASHPDDFREDLKVAEQMQSDKSPSVNDEGAALKNTPLKSKPAKRR